MNQQYEYEEHGVTIEVLRDNIFENWKNQRFVLEAKLKFFKYKIEQQKSQVRKQDAQLTKLFKEKEAEKKKVCKQLRQIMQKKAKKQDRIQSLLSLIQQKKEQIYEMAQPDSYTEGNLTKERAMHLYFGQKEAVQKAIDKEVDISMGRR